MDVARMLTQISTPPGPSISAAEQSSAYADVKDTSKGKFPEKEKKKRKASTKKDKKAVQTAKEKGDAVVAGLLRYKSSKPPALKKGNTATSSGGRIFPILSMLGMEDEVDELASSQEKGQ